MTKKSSHAAAKPGITAIAFMRVHKALLVFSLFLVLASIFGWVVVKPNYGIDFTGGLVIELRVDKPVELEGLRHALEESQKGGVSLQHFGSDQDVMIRLQAFEGENQKERVEGLKQIIATTLPDVTVDYRKTDYVGPQVGEELKTSGLVAAVLAFAAIMVYVWFRFEWQFGMGALLSLLHDAALAMGLYVLLQLPFDLTSVAAVLTILGYSVNDSVVIYDRLRENLRKYKKMPLAELIDLSLNETLSRTIMTGATTLLALLALIVLGGPVIRDFCLIIFLGVIIGTYSSVFVSAPVLLYFNLRREDAEPAQGAKAAV